MKKIFSLLLLIYALSATANDSSKLRISLLTCTPGEDLYATFGHSALRVYDSTNGSDIVYNYGTFNFNDEGFYLKFARGQLLYYVSTTSFQEFLWEYQYFKRGITEQLLNLNQAEKVAVRNALTDNLREENKYYKYDFVLDNCTTRLRDIIVKHKKNPPELPPAMPVNYSFRNAIHHYLNLNNKYWSKLGIDLLLGATTDRIMSIPQQQFLPDNLMISLDSARPQNIVLAKSQAYDFHPSPIHFSLLTPMVVFGILALIFVLFHFYFKSKSRKLPFAFDLSLFFVTGLLGIILLLMWFATDHSMTKNNYNLLWAFPLHTYAAFKIRSANKSIKKYWLMTCIILLFLLASWIFLPQQMNPAFIPLVLLLLFRSWIIYKS